MKTIPLTLTFRDDFSIGSINLMEDLLEFITDGLANQTITFAPSLMKLEDGSLRLLEISIIPSVMTWPNYR